MESSIRFLPVLQATLPGTDWQEQGMPTHFEAALQNATLFLPNKRIDERKLNQLLFANTKSEFGEQTQSNFRVNCGRFVCAESPRKHGTGKYQASAMSVDTVHPQLGWRGRSVYSTSLQLEPHGLCSGALGCSDNMRVVLTAQHFTV